MTARSLACSALFVCAGWASASQNDISKASWQARYNWMTRLHLRRDFGALAALMDADYGYVDEATHTLDRDYVLQRERDSLEDAGRVALRMRVLRVRLVEGYLSVKLDRRFVVDHVAIGGPVREVEHKVLLEDWRRINKKWTLVGSTVEHIDYQFLRPKKRRPNKTRPRHRAHG